MNKVGVAGRACGRCVPDLAMGHMLKWHQDRAVGAVSIATVGLLMSQSYPAAAITTDYSWQPCAAGSTCVSSNSIMQPAQYLPPWLYYPATQEAAFRALMDELNARAAQLINVDEAQAYISAQVPYGRGPQDYDILQFRVQPDGIVLFKSDAAVNKPYPPFCFVPGCISGPSNRQRLEGLRNDLGWTVLEPDDDKQWVQILLH